MTAKPIIPWIGGKRRLAKHLLPLFPEHTCYVEPFCGAAALFFMKDRAKSEILNDINGDIINLYRVVQRHLEELIRQFKWSLVSREMYKWLKNANTDSLTDIQRAARFFYLQKLSFGGKVQGRAFGTSTTSLPKLNLLRIEEELSQAHLRLAQATIEHLEWHECMKRYDRPHSLIYLDPPYYGTEGYGVPFALEEYDRMADLAHHAKGHVIISVNDIPEMHKAFNGLRIRSVDVLYTVSNVHGKGAKRKELIITNW